MDDENPQAPTTALSDDRGEDQLVDDGLYEEYDEFGTDDQDQEMALAAASDSAEQLRGLVHYLAQNLVDDPESVEVEARQRGGSVFVSLRVPEEELGRVIGRGGRIARAMRTALMIAGSRNNVRASLDIED